MKNKLIFITMLSLVLFAGCTKTEEVEPAEETTVEVTEPVEAIVEESTEEENTLDVNPAEIQGTLVNGDYVFDNYSLSLPGDWLEINTLDEDGFIARSLTSTKDIMIQMSVTEAPDSVVDENSISEEIGTDSYLNLEQETQVELDDGTMFYGGYIDDHATSVQFCYYKTKVDSEVVAIIFSKKYAYSEDDLIWIHDILSTFKIIE